MQSHLQPVLERMLRTSEKDICDYLGYLGVELDEEKNENVHGETTVISTPESKVKVIVLPTNEELAIARETAKLV